MILEHRGHDYPKQTIEVMAFPRDFSQMFPKPNELIEGSWPPDQITYLGEYLHQLGCETVAVESHYVDRDYVDDVALFYSRSLRAYPNYCYRLHFFTEKLDQPQWQSLITLSAKGELAKHRKMLQDSYLGFAVIRPLPGVPLGRTVLKTFAETTITGERRVFGGVREYKVHLGGFQLSVIGLAFQQQDQGVSACATTALWSAMHRVAPREDLPVPTPADITEAASRYLLLGGRSLPNGGLSIYEIFEATRAAGLSPLLIQCVSLDHDRAQILGYAASGFPPVLAVQPLVGGDGHAVCVVGVKLGKVAPGTDPKIQFRDAATSVCGVYLHDDRLGPYASGTLDSYTIPETGKVRTRLTIRWPGEPVVFEEHILTAIIVPVPPKLRLTIARMRGLAALIAQVIPKAIPQFSNLVTINCLYTRGDTYREKAFEFGLSDNALFTLQCGIPLSRYVGLIELSVDSEPLLDIVLDATETEANPSVLVCVRRLKWPEDKLEQLRGLGQLLGKHCLI